MSDESDTKLVTSQVGQQVEIKEVEGRTQITFRKAILKGKVTSAEVLNTILIAAKLQAELYIKKLGTGTPLEVQEVKALKELSEITKLEAPEQKSQKPQDFIDIDSVKANLHSLLSEKLK